ncbi:hypothetical protein NUW58_g1110 [Xylaria curta]|uniref:Uncharacterized protein n=1 Tax=Xylaria curta TaxID=42375 RepID=A0ACC1PLN3_9PEZI|nr:hypothetical protein NUW58_g1110 [Xylaria curta]
MSTSRTITDSHVEGSTGYALTSPSETSTSYFPKGATATTAAIASATPLDGSSPGSSYPLSPMDREYTKPPQDLDIAHQLSKQPTYWSAKGWIQRSASSSAQSATEDPEAKTRKFEETKRDLLASVGRF